MTAAAHSHLLVLVAPAGGALGRDDLEAAFEAAARAGAVAGEPAWTTPGRAVDLAIAAGDVAFERAIRSALGERRLDLALVPAAGRRKRLLLADLESTVIENEMLDELAAEAGQGERIAAITARAMNGELDFRAALAERLALLRGTPVEALERARGRIRLDPGARALVAGMRAAGARTALVSGGFEVFARPIAEALGFDAVHANRLEIADGRLTGRVAEPVLDRDAKLRLLDALAGERGLGREECVAVGDGANDLPMLAAAGLGVAYHAKPAVAAAARHRVDHGDLSTLLAFQGLPLG